MDVRFTSRSPGRLAAGALAEGPRLLASASAGPHRAQLTRTEWALLAACADPEREAPPAEASIPQLIAEQVCIRPSEVAVVADGEELSYAQLWARSGALAARLRGSGVRRGNFVGLYCRRSLALIVGMLGILRSGAAYVPLDPDCSPEELSYVRDDADLRAIVAQSDVTPPDSRCRTIPFDAEPVRLEDADAPGLFEDDPWAAGPDDLACMVYAGAASGPARTVISSHRTVLKLHTAQRRFD